MAHSRAIALPAWRRRCGERSTAPLATGNEGRAVVDLGGRFDGARLAVHTSFAASEDLWRRAVAEGVCYGFQTFEWLSTYQATIGEAAGASPQIVHLSDRAGRSLLVLPLGIYQAHGLRVLRFLGGGVTDYHAPVIDPDFAAGLPAAAAARLWQAVLRALPRVDVVWLEKVPATIEGVANPLAALPGIVHMKNAYAAALPASGAEFRARRASLFQEMRRKRRRLAERAGPVEFGIAVTPEAAAEVLRVIMPHKAQRWRATGGPDHFADPAYRAFYERLTAASFETADAGVQACFLRAGGTMVATHWGMHFRNRMYYLVAGRAEGEWQRFSPGSLLIEKMIDWCIAHPEITTFDLTGGEEAYKRRWADQSLELFEYISARTASGALFVAAYRAATGLKARLKRYPRLVDLVHRIRRRPRA